MSSEAFSKNSDTLKPTVQVGDPFSEKLLMEACLELMDNNLVIGLQDMGAAGLTSSAVEIAASSKMGIKLNLDNVPLRDGEMNADEIMLSESQERMLMIISPGKIKLAKKSLKSGDYLFPLSEKLQVLKILIYTLRKKELLIFL